MRRKRRLFVFNHTRYADYRKAPRSSFLSTNICDTSINQPPKNEKRAANSEAGFQFMEDFLTCFC